jgi:hypothetical protein
MQKHWLSGNSRWLFSREIDPASRIVSRHYSLVRYSRSVTWKRLTKCPARDYEIALPPARGSLIWFTIGLGSLSLCCRSTRGTNFAVTFSPAFGQDARDFRLPERIRKRISILIRLRVIREKRAISRRYKSGREDKHLFTCFPLSLSYDIFKAKQNIYSHCTQTFCEFSVESVNSPNFNNRKSMTAYDDRIRNFIEQKRFGDNIWNKRAGSLSPNANEHYDNQDLHLLV